MPRWTFVRHAESTANAEGWLAGHTDAPLTDRGRHQALGLRRALQGLPFDRVYTSDLRRAVETAEIALPGCSLSKLSGLRERSLGILEGRRRNALTDDERYHHLLDPRGRPPGGESHHQLVSRVVATMSRIDDNADVLVVAHGGVLRAILTIVDDLQPDDAVRLRLPNVCIQTRALDVGFWRVVATNTQHL